MVVATIKISTINNIIKVNTPNTPNNIFKNKKNFFPLYFVISK